MNHALSLFLYIAAYPILMTSFQLICWAGKTITLGVRKIHPLGSS